MLRHLTLTALLSPTFALAGETSVQLEPTKDKKAQLEAISDKPKNIMVQTEWIKLKTGVIEKLILKHKDTGSTLRTEIQKLVKQKNASIIDTSLITQRSGETARVTSAQQMIYPTQFDHTQIDGLGSIDPDRYTSTSKRNGATVWTAFEERPVGSMLESQPTLGIGRSENISLELVPELITLANINTLREHKDQWGHQKIEFPIFTKQKTRTGVTLKSGQYQLISYNTATLPDGKKDPEHTIALFTRAITRVVSP